MHNRTGVVIHVTARDDRRTQALGEVAAMDVRAFQARWTRRTDISFLIQSNGALVCVPRGVEAESGRTVVLTVDPAPADATAASTEGVACDAVVVS